MLTERIDNIQVNLKEKTAVNEKLQKELRLKDQTYSEMLHKFEQTQNDYLKEN